MTVFLIAGEHCGAEQVAELAAAAAWHSVQHARELRTSAEEYARKDEHAEGWNCARAH